MLSPRPAGSPGRPWPGEHSPSPPGVEGSGTGSAIPTGQTCSLLLAMAVAFAALVAAGVRLNPSLPKWVFGYGAIWEVEMRDHTRELGRGLHERCQKRASCSRRAARWEAGRARPGSGDSSGYEEVFQVLQQR